MIHQSFPVQLGGCVPSDNEVNELADAIADDREWFERHPERSYRIRLATPTERRRAHAAEGRSPNGADTMVAVVYQIKPGFRSRAYAEYPFSPYSSEWLKLSAADDRYLAELFAFIVADMLREFLEVFHKLSNVV